MRTITLLGTKMKVSEYAQSLCWRVHPPRIACVFGLGSKYVLKVKLSTMSLFDLLSSWLYAYFFRVFGEGLGFGLHVKCFGDIAVFIATHPVQSLFVFTE